MRLAGGLGAAALLVALAAPTASAVVAPPSAPQSVHAQTVAGWGIALTWYPPSDAAPDTTYTFFQRAADCAGLECWAAVAPDVSAERAVLLRAPEPGVVYGVAAVGTGGTSPVVDAGETNTNAWPVGSVEAGSVAESSADLPWGLYAAFGSLQLPLEVDGHEHRDPAALADGTGAVYARAVSAGLGAQDFDLWVRGVGPDDAPRRLTDLPGSETDPEVSRDGLRVAFTYTPPGGAPQIRMVPLAGGSSTLVRGGAQSPTWSDRDRLIAEDLVDPGLGLAEVDLAGTVVGRVPGTAGGSDPSVSPDGSEVAFVSADGRPARHYLALDVPTEVAEVPAGTWSDPFWVESVPWYSARLEGADRQGRVLLGLGSAASEWTSPALAATRLPSTSGFPFSVLAGPADVRPGGSVEVRANDGSEQRADAFRLTCAITGYRAAFDCSDGVLPMTTAAGAALPQGRYPIVVTGMEPFGRTAQTASTITVDGSAPPRPTVSLPSWSTGPAVRATFSSKDAWTTVTYEARFRTMLYGWSQPEAWSAVYKLYGSTSVGMTPPRDGGRRCLQVRARDNVGFVSSWSEERCVSGPLDDRRFIAKGSGVTRITGNAAYIDGTATSLRRTGAVMAAVPAVKASRFVVIATSCATCGSLVVLHNGVKVGTVNLATQPYKASRAFVLPASVTRFGQLEVVTRSAKLVRIDALIGLR